MVIRARLRYRIRVLLTAVAAAMILVYFGYHAVSGRYGLMANRELETEISALQQELSSIMKEKSSLEHRMSLLRPEALDRDLLEEQARVQLGFIHPNEVVIFIKKQ